MLSARMTILRVSAAADAIVLRHGVSASGNVHAAHARHGRGRARRRDVDAE